MDEIKLTPELKAAIGQIDGDKKLVDENGNVIGFIITPMMHQVIDAFDASLSQELDSTEEDESDYVTTAEMIEWLETHVPGFKGAA